MSKLISLKMRMEDYKALEEWVKKTKKNRNAYINEAVQFYNRFQKRFKIGADLRRESRLVRAHSMEINREFDAIIGETLKGTMMTVRRGKLYLADLGKKFGTEPGKIRPVLIVQTDWLNEDSHPSTLVVPLTSQLEPQSKKLRIHVHKSELTGLDRDSDLLLDQLSAIDNGRFKKELGGVTAHIMERVNENLRLILDLEP